MRKPLQTILALTLVGAFAGVGTLAQAQLQEESGRVISSTPMRDADGQTVYSVRYEYAGREYTVRMAQPPGAQIPLQVTPLGVTTMPVEPQYAQPNDDGASPWATVVPEPGVVVGAGAPAPAYPAPVYAAPPVVYAPAPVYAQPAYGYAPYPYLLGAPIGLSLNLGYSRGWRGGGWHGGAGWRGGYHRGWR